MLRISYAAILGAAFLLLSVTADSDVICKVCECEAETKFIDCAARGLSNHSPNASSWTTLPFQPIRLDFQHNVLVHVHPLPTLPNLEKLNLRDNRISRLDGKCFLNLTALKVLDLSHNELTTESLKADIFEGHYAPESYEPIPGLTSLDLSYNALHALNEGVFQHFPHLEVLSLRGNPLRVIDRGTLMALSSLDHLRMPVYQAIQDALFLWQKIAISRHQFDQRLINVRLNGSQVLDLSSTQISALPDYMLHRPLHLENLDLSYNAFTAPPPGLTDTHGLKRLDFSGNNLNTLTSFPDLPYLTTLVLNHCSNLTTIGKGALSNLTSLNHLNISNNPRLSLIDEDALSRTKSKDIKTWPNITKLSLTGNSLTELPMHLLKRWDVLDELNLDENPWACECNNQWIITILIPLMEKKIPMFGYALQCASPPELAREPVRSMSRFHHLRCADYYGNRPERDTSMLIGVLIGVLIACPVTAALIMIWRRGIPLLGRRTVVKETQRAYYKRVDSENENTMHM